MRWRGLFVPYFTQGSLPVTQFRNKDSQNEGLTPFLYPYHNIGFPLNGLESAIV